MPDIYIQIRRLIKQPDSSIDDFVELIANDSTLSHRIMRIANSDFFGFSRKAESLNHAINLIGIIQLHDLMLCSLCMRTFSSIPSQVLNLDAFWFYSTQCGIAARLIAQHSFIPISNHYFSLGLLHEIGHLAMYSKEPELSLQVLEESQQQGKKIQQLEQQYFGCDYTQIGKALMQLWHLPEVYQQVTSFHLQPELAKESCHFEVQIIHLAHIICQNPVMGSHQKLITSIQQLSSELKNLPSNIDEIIIKEINTHTGNVLAILQQDTDQGIALEEGLLNDE